MLAWCIAMAMLLAAASASAATPQEQVEARRRSNPNVIVDVVTGERLRGTIERTMAGEFYLADQSGLDRILVPYFAVKALVDPDSGAPIPFDAPPQSAPREAAGRPPEAETGPAPAGIDGPAHDGVNAGAAGDAGEGMAGGGASGLRSAPLLWLAAIAGIGVIWAIASRWRRS
ncbi:MAG: hypothetical protein IT176_09610 [Acidobacteria bacterium]|nr:hypothetical protein [Acidobacteriota bacterium]